MNKSQWYLSYFFPGAVKQNTKIKNHDFLKKDFHAGGKNEFEELLTDDNGEEAVEGILLASC